MPWPSAVALRTVSVGRSVSSCSWSTGASSAGAVTFTTLGVVGGWLLVAAELVPALASAPAAIAVMSTWSSTSAPRVKRTKTPRATQPIGWSLREARWICRSRLFDWLQPVPGVEEGNEINEFRSFFLVGRRWQILQTGRRLGWVGTTTAATNPACRRRLTLRISAVIDPSWLHVRDRVVYTGQPRPDRAAHMTAQRPVSEKNITPLRALRHLRSRFARRESFWRPADQAGNREHHPRGPVLQEGPGGIPDHRVPGESAGR